MADNPGAPTGTAPAVYGISVNGTLPALAVQVETALGNSPQNNVRGRDETNRARRRREPAPSRRMAL